jgi:hypothetical protein
MRVRAACASSKLMVRANGTLLALPWPLALALAALTVLLGFGVNALAHAWLRRRGDPLVRDHRGTLHFLSAWVGDGLLLPLINLAGADLLARSGGPPTPTEWRWAALTGLALTSAIHGVQAARGLTNWSMPRPWRWNLAGWYHFAFMTGQVSLLAAVLGRFGRRWREHSAAVWRDAGVILAGLLLFGALLAWDYRPR